MKKTILLVALILGSTLVNAQNFNSQKRTFIFTNIGINGVIGGIGALINKKSGEKPLKVFAKGFGQGCLGGSFQVLGKELTYQINSKEQLRYAWMARLTNAVGNSITQNAASNINFWERWHFNIGFLRLDYLVKERKLKTRIFASSLYGIVSAGSQAKLNLKKTFQSGILIYESDGFVSSLGRSSIGIGLVSSIAYYKDIDESIYYGLMAHETMHILQYDNMVWINPMLIKKDKKMKAQSSFYKKASKYVYLDFNGLTILGLYLTQLHRPWECRYIEREADHFSRKITHASCP